MTMFPDNHYAHCAHCGEHLGMGLITFRGRSHVECLCGARGPAVDRSAYTRADGELDLAAYDDATRRAWNTRAGSDGRAELEAKLLDWAARVKFYCTDFGREPSERMIAERVMWEDFLLKGKPEGVEATHEPTWHPFPAMKALPRGWYWAPFPGDWVWYCPERNMARGIDHGDTNWHDLQSVRYWGPWVPPTTAA